MEIINILVLDKWENKTRRLKEQIFILELVYPNNTLTVTILYRWIKMRDLKNIQTKPDVADVLSYNSVLTQDTNMDSESVGCWCCHWTILKSIMGMEAYKPIFVLADKRDQVKVKLIFFISDSIYFDFFKNNRLKPCHVFKLDSGSWKPHTSLQCSSRICEVLINEAVLPAPSASC